MDEIYASTRGVYQCKAAQFDTDRARDGREEKWLEKFVEFIPEGGRILDLGCGTGEPIAAWLIDRGFNVTGVDYSEPMLKIARRRFPGSAWVLNDMRDLCVSGPFHGIISWHGSFHLSPPEQRVLIPKLAKLLAPDGALMLTIGTGEGEVTGTVGGETVYHSSLDPAEYRSLLEAEGAQNVTFHLEEPEGPYVLLAKK